LRDGYMPVLKDENDEHCYFLRPIFGCKDDDSSSDDVDGISDSEAIHSKSDGTESSSIIASSTGTVSVGGSGNSARFSGSDDDDKLDEDNFDNESSLLIENSIQFNTMSDHCTNC
jgi:hypothetical protein